MRSFLKYFKAQGKRRNLVQGNGQDKYQGKLGDGE